MIVGIAIGVFIGFGFGAYVGIRWAAPSRLARDIVRYGFDGTIQHREHELGRIDRRIATRRARLSRKGGGSA